MGRSDRGYMEPTKRERNLQKLKERKDKKKDENLKIYRTVDNSIARFVREQKETRKELLKKERNRIKRAQQAQKLNDKNEIDRLKKELDVIGRKSAEVDKRIKSKISSLEREKKIIQSKPPKNANRTKQQLDHIDYEIKYLKSILEGEKPKKAFVPEPKPVKKLQVKIPPHTSLPEDSSAKAKRERAEVKKRLSLVSRKMQTLQHQINQVKSKEGRDAKKKEINELEAQYEQLYRKLYNIERSGGIRRNRSRGIIGARYAKKANRYKKNRGGSRLRFGGQSNSIYIKSLNEYVVYSEHYRDISEIRFLVIPSQKEYDVLLQGDWLKKAGHRKKFAIGIAAPSEKVSFRGNNSCDAYVDISDIVKEGELTPDIKKKIEDRCKVYLNTEKDIRFFYISDKVPFILVPKLITFVSIHGRPGVTSESIKRLYRQGEYINEIIVVGDNIRDESIANKLNVTYIEYYNDPLSWKHQVAVDVARLREPDGIMVSGSDDWLSDNWCAECTSYLKEYDVIGSGDGWAVKMVNGKPKEILHHLYNRREDTFGPGRIISAKALDRIDWKLYMFNRNNSLDGYSWRSLHGDIDGRGRPSKRYNVRKKIVERISCLAIKGDWEQMNPFEAVKRTSIPPSYLIDNPVEWMNKTFPGWEKSFGRMK